MLQKGPLKTQNCHITQFSKETVGKFATILSQELTFYTNIVCTFIPFPSLALILFQNSSTQNNWQKLGQNERNQAFLNMIRTSYEPNNFEIALLDQTLKYFCREGQILPTGGVLTGRASPTRLICFKTGQTKYYCLFKSKETLISWRV